jgi:hypothetical protein
MKKEVHQEAMALTNKVEQHRDNIIVQEFGKAIVEVMPIKNGKNVVCCCGFCLGKAMRQDIQHYKLFVEKEYRGMHDTPQAEYYLDIDVKTGNYILTNKE